MSKKEKIKEKFLNAPRTLAYSKIYTFMMSEWYIDKMVNGGSHTKLEDPKSWKVFIIPLHNWECKPKHKELIKNFYLATQ